MVKAILCALTKPLSASEPFRRLFGKWRGLWLWFSLRRHLWRRHGDLHKVNVPGLRHPLFLRARTSDVLVFTQIFVERELDFNLSHAPRTIVDAGANIGLASLYFSSRFPNAKILALEVEHDNFELLRLNTQGYPNVRCVRKALWSRNGFVNVVNPTADPWAFQVAGQTQRTKDSIPAVAVDDLIRQFDGRIDLLKVDIEGAELGVLRAGAERWMDRIGTIAVELHDHIQPGCTEALEKALNGRPHRKSKSGEYTVVYLAD
jgi:FkbM family methyltransferase